MSKQQKQGVSKAFAFGLMGFLLGFPLSYFFQVPLIRQKVSLVEYVKNIPQLLSSIGSPNPQDQALLGDVIAPIIVTCLVCTALMAVMGHFLEQSKKNVE